MYKAIQYPTKAEGISKFYIINEDNSVITYDLREDDNNVK